MYTTCEPIVNSRFARLPAAADRHVGVVDVDSGGEDVRYDRAFVPVLVGLGYHLDEAWPDQLVAIDDLSVFLDLM